MAANLEYGVGILLIIWGSYVLFSLAARPSKPYVLKLVFGVCVLLVGIYVVSM